MSNSVIDSLFEDPLSDSLPGSDLDLFLDQLPASDISTFPIDIPVGCDDKLIREKDVWDFEPETIELPKRVKSEILSDGGSPDSSDRYSRGSDDESDELISDSLLNVDIFLNKPGSGSIGSPDSENDVMVNIPRLGAYPAAVKTNRSRSEHVRCSNLKGRDVTEEERKLLEEDGVAIPYNVILTKNEERALKKVRRKIKNKISAAESRKRRKEYIGGLERRVEEHTVVNVKLQKTIDELQKRNRSLMEQLKRAVSAASKCSVSSQTATSLMGVFLSFTIFLFPLLFSPFQSAPAAPATSNYIPGRSLLSISESPKTSFIESVVEYIVEKIQRVDIYETQSELTISNYTGQFYT